MLTKTCTKCSIEKPIEGFGWRNKTRGTRQSWCRSCFRSHDRNCWKENSNNRRGKHREKANLRNRRNRKFIFEFLSQKSCEHCGECDPIVLEFDHIDPSTKDASVSEFVKSAYSLKKIREEIEKCRILCANCHRRVTAKQQGWDRLGM